MRRHLSPLTLSLAALLLAVTPALAMVEESPGDARPGRSRRDLIRIMVKFREGASDRQVREAHGRARGRVTWRSRADRWEAVALEPGADPERALLRYSLNPAVEEAEVAAPREIAAAPNDLLVQQWMFHNEGEPMLWCCPRLRCQPCSSNKKATYVEQGTAGADINAPEAWDLATGSREIVVAVLDTGIDLERADLAEHVIDGWDFVNDDNEPDDDHDHGTGVSALIGAVGNNGQGITGLNWSVSLMPVKVCDKSGECTTDNVVAGIHYAVDHGADVINMSLACDEHRDPNTRQCTASLPGTCFTKAEHDAIARAWSRGVVVVEAAGNCGTDNDDATTAYPCAYDIPGNICAGATDMNDKVASFSSYGPQTVEIGAPGARVTTYNGGREDNYWQPSGTSFASPITAGVAALLLTRTPLSPAVVRERIVAGGNTSGEAGGVFMGGRLDAFRTLENVFLTPRPMSPGLDDPPADVTLLADVTGDGRADLVRGIAGVGFQVSKTKGKKEIFKRPKVWSETPPAPHVLAGDVDGNGRKDIILAETGAGIQVLRAAKKKARPLEGWSAEDPGLLLLAGDVDGDGREDAIRYDGAFQVLRSTGSRFEDPVPWSAEGIRDLALLGDVNGDGRADLIHWSDLSGATLVEVSLSTGSAFDDPVIWLETIPLSFRGLDDMDGDGRDDLVALDPATGCMRVMRGRNSSFAPDRAWTCQGSPDLLFTGQASRNRKDGRADLVTWKDGIGWELVQSIP